MMTVLLFLTADEAGDAGLAAYDTVLAVHDSGDAVLAAYEAGDAVLAAHDACITVLAVDDTVDAVFSFHKGSQ